MCLHCVSAASSSCHNLHSRSSKAVAPKAKVDAKATKAKAKERAAAKGSLQTRASIDHLATLGVHDCRGARAGVLSEGHQADKFCGESSRYDQDNALLLQRRSLVPKKWRRCAGKASRTSRFAARRRKRSSVGRSNILSRSRTKNSERSPRA